MPGFWVASQLMALSNRSAAVVLPPSAREPHATSSCNVVGTDQGELWVAVDDLATPVGLSGEPEPPKATVEWIAIAPCCLFPTRRHAVASRHPGDAHSAPVAGITAANSHRSWRILAARGVPINRWVT